MKLNIEDFIIESICKTLEFRIISSTEENFGIYYVLKKQDGSIAEEGNKTLPINLIGLFSPPYNIPFINQVLSTWGIVATSTAE
jgi:hypothetical protein